jgi:hypothetical protein
MKAATGAPTKKRHQQKKGRLLNPATACKKANYSRETIYTAAETSTAAGPPESVGKSAAVEKSVTCSWDTGCWIPDAINVRNSMEASS